MKDERLYLIHIVECIERVEKYTEDGREAFINSTLVQDGVIRNLQVMAESTQRLLGTTKAGHPEIPWERIANFRNVITHGYMDLDLSIIWTVVERDIPPLKRCVATIIAERYGTAPSR
jgi:uncharacterized protein with HEPN domain